MPQYEINVPGSGTYRVDSPTELTPEQAYAAIQAQIAAAPPEKKPDTGFLAALGSGFRGGLGEAAESAGAFAGLPGLQAFGKRQQEQAEKGYAPLTNEQVAAAGKEGLLSDIGASARQFLEPYAKSAGSIAGRFGAPIAAAAGTALALPEALAAAPFVGGSLGAIGLGTVGAAAGVGAMALADAPIEIGQKKLERERAGLPPDPLKDIQYGLTATALNTVSGGVLSGPIKGVLGRSAAQQAAELAPRVLAGEITSQEAAGQISGLLKNVLHGTAENAVVGTGMMVGNEALSRAAVGQDLTSPEAQEKYLEATKGALALAPMFGLAHGIGARSSAEKALNEAGATRAGIEAEKQKAVDAAAAAQEEARKQSPEYIDRVEQQYADLQNSFANLKAQASVKVDPADLAGAARLVEAKKALKEFMADDATKATVQKYNRIQKLKPQEATTETAPTTPAADPRQQLADINSQIEALQTQAQGSAGEQLINFGKQHSELKAQLAEVQKAVDALPPTTPAAPTPVQITKQIKDRTKAKNKALEEGNIDVAAKHEQKITELNAQLQAPEVTPTVTTPTTLAAPKPVAAKPLKPYTGIAEQSLMFPETGEAESVINLGQGKNPNQSRQEIIAEFQAAKQVRDRLGMQNAIEKMRTLAQRSDARSEAARGNGVPQGELSKGLPAMMGQKLTAIGSQPASRELINAAKTEVTPQTLRRQIESLPENLSPENEQLVNRMLGNFDEFTADPERAQLAAGFLQDVRTGIQTARSQDVADELTRIEASKRREAPTMFSEEEAPVIEGPRKPLPVTGYSEEALPARVLKQPEPPAYEKASAELEAKRKALDEERKDYLQKAETEAAKREQAALQTYNDASVLYNALKAEQDAKLNPIYADYVDAMRNPGKNKAAAAKRQVDTALLYQTAKTNREAAMADAKADMEKTKAALEKVRSDNKQALADVKYGIDLTQGMARVGLKNKGLGVEIERTQAKAAQPPRQRKPKTATSLAERENANAAERKTANERAERLATIPGESISFEAYRTARNIVGDVDTVSARLEALRAKAADESLPKSTRDKARRDELAITRAQKYIAGSNEGLAATRAEAEKRLVKVEANIEKKIAAIAENPLPSRKQTLGELKREKKKLEAQIKSYKERAERTTLNTPTEKAAKAADARAERFMRLQEAMAIEGTTGALPAREVGPVVRKAQAAANIRTGEGGEAGTETRRIGPGTKPEQGGATKAPTLKQAVEDANKVAEEKLANSKELTSTDIKMLDLRQHFALFEAAQNMRRGLERNLVELNEKMERAAQAVNPTEKNVTLRKERLEQKAGIERDIAMAKANEERLGKMYTEEAPAEEVPKTVKKAKKTRAQKAIEDLGEEGMQRGTSGANDTPLSEQNISRLRSGDVGGVLAQIAGSSENQVARRVAGKVQSILGENGVSIRLVDKTTEAAPNAPGMISKNGRRISINERTGLSEESVLHESVHAATMFELDKPDEKLTPDQRVAKKGLTKMMEQVKADDDFDNNVIKEGDIHEFVAEGNASKAVQAYMRKETFDNRNMWQKFKDFLLRLVGVKTPPSESMLNKFLDMSEKFMRAKEEGASDLPTAKLRTAKYNPALKDAGEMAERVVDTQRPLSEKMNSNSFGRAAKEFEIKAVDQYAGVLHHAKQMEQLAGSQMQYYLRMVGQRLNLLGQAVGRGFPELTSITRPDGRIERLYESKDGSPALVHVAQKLVSANKLTGSEAATNNLFSLYEIAKRANDVGIDKMNYSADITKEKLDKAVQQIKSVPGLAAIFDDAHNAYRDFNKDGIKFAVSTGAFSKELGAKLLANKDYVPYYRESPDGTVSLWMGNESITKVGNIKDQPYLHELVGGNTRIVDFATSSVRNANMLLDMGLRNQATKNVAYELKKIGLAEVRKGQTRARPNTIQFKVDGVDHHAVIESTPDMPAELLVKGMAGIPVQTSALLNMVGFPSRVIRTMFVANPLSAARTLFKGTLSSSLIAGTDLSALPAAFKSVKDNLMEKRGISGGEVYTGLPADLTNILRQVQSGKPGWEHALAIGHAMHAKADAMGRQINYSSFKKQGLSDMEATLAALEAENFTRRGISPSLHILSAINPFMNSQIQGINTLVKALRGNMPFNEKLKIRQKIIQRGMMLAGATMLYTTLMQDDDTYKKATPDQRYNNFLIPFPGLDEKLRVPIPFEAGLLFKSVPEALVNYMHGHDKDAATGMRMVIQNLIPGGSSEYVPQILKPAIEVGLGKSLYTGRDIESRHEQALVPSERSRDTTSSLATAMGHSLGLDPIMVDYLISGYTGSLGLAVTKMASSLVFGNQPGVQPEKTLSQQPVIGALFQPKDAGNIVDEAYQSMKEAQQVQATVKDLIAKNRVTEAKAFLEKNATEYAKAELEPKFASAMNQTQKALQAIAASTTMTPAEKRAAIDKIKEQRSKIAAQVIEAGGRTTPH